jgi:tetratricopeptide (TPR) repeat protein
MAYDLAIFGFVNERAGHYAEAERADVRAIALFKKWRGPDEEWIAITCANLGRVMLDVNRPKDALRQYEASLAVYRAGKQSGADLAHPYTGMGEAWLALKQAARAAPPLEQALALRESGKVPPRDLARTRYQLARALEGTHEHARACELADAASAAYEANPLATSAGLRETSDARDWLSAHCAH